MELQILDWIQTFRTPIGDAFWSIITVLGNAGIFWIVISFIFICIPKMRRTGLIMFAALIMDVILCDGITKHVFARTRPYEFRESIELLIERPKDYSFPSGHTAASFAVVTALYKANEKILWKCGLVLAILIAFSRLYLYVHYPTDVFGGIVVGIIAGLTGYYIFEFVCKKMNSKKAN